MHIIFKPLNLLHGRNIFSKIPYEKGRELIAESFLMNETGRELIARKVVKCRLIYTVSLLLLGYVINCF